MFSVFLQKNSLLIQKNVNKVCHIIKYITFVFPSKSIGLIFKNIKMIIDSVLNRNSKALKVIDINHSSKEDVLSTNEQPVEKVKRSLAKTISWRIIGTLDTLLLSWIIIGEASTAALIASVEFVSKMILYFFHERAWTKIKWGK